MKCDPRKPVFLQGNQSVIRIWCVPIDTYLETYFQPKLIGLVFSLWRTSLLLWNEVNICFSHILLNLSHGVVVPASECCEYVLSLVFLYCQKDIQAVTTIKTCPSSLFIWRQKRNDEQAQLSNIPAHGSNQFYVRFVYVHFVFWMWFLEFVDPFCANLISFQHSLKFLLLDFTTTRHYVCKSNVWVLCHSFVTCFFSFYLITF